VWCGWTLALVIVVLLGGCGYSRQEPGLFRPPPAPPSADPTGPGGPTPHRLPEPTNRQLPVLGEQIWSTGEGLALTVRFAVHAVRRTAAATILDWSVTPLPSSRLEVGDAVPTNVDLGLGRDDNGDQRIYLLDGTGRAYRPLAHKSPEEFHHCLCTPLWVAQLALRVGETRMLQLAYPPLPASIDHVDVSLPNTMPFWQVPVMPEGTVPLAMRSVDLARPPDVPQAASRELPFTESDQPLGRRRSITLLDLQSGPSGTTLTWRVASREDQPFPAFSFGSPPVSAPFGARPWLRSTSVASGPVIRVDRADASPRWLRARWLTSSEPVAGYLECLCSDFGLWAAGLRTAGGGVEVSTTYAPLPAGTRRVDVVLPELGTVRGVPLTAPAIDADRAVLGVGRVIVSTWTYSTANPPAGWLTSDWPTRVPAASQLRDYTAGIDRIVDLPTP